MKSPTPKSPTPADAEAPVAAASRAADLARLLREKIVAGEFKIDDTLPSERELMVQFGAARATVREALRVLGAQGLTEVRRGRNGGSIVRAPSTEAVRNTLELFISGNDVSYADIVDVREALEPVAAAQAAARRDEADLSAILDLCYQGEKTLPDIHAFAEVNIKFHLAIVKASRNKLFDAFMLSITPILHAATDMEEFSYDIRKVVAETHWQIFWAIRDQDVEAARRRMSRHVGAYAETLETFESLKTSLAPQEQEQTG